MGGGEERTPCGIAIEGRKGGVGGLELCTYIISMAMGKSFFFSFFLPPPQKSDVSNFEQGDFS